MAGSEGPWTAREYYLQPYDPMALSLPNKLSSATLGAGLGLLLGIAVALYPLAGLGVVLVALTGLALAAPTPAWVGASILLAVGGRALVPLGIPDALALGALPLAWVAFGLGAYRYRGNPIADRVALGTAALIGLIGASTLINLDDPARAPLYLALLVTPFALVAALVFDPPDAVWRRRLTLLLAGLIIAQIPFALWQTYSFGISDFVQGTFINSKVGAHTTAGISLLGAIWFALQGGLTRGRVAVIVMLLFVPLLAAANQVIFALPLALIGVAMVSNRRLAIAASLGTGLLLALLLLPGWNSDYARSSFDRVAFALKADSAAAVGEQLTESPGALLAGQGPATTVSHAAFLTAEEDSFLAALGIEPAELPNSFGLRAIEASLSIKRPESSLLGIFGDLGLLGAIAYLALFAYVFNQCRIRPTAAAQTAAVGLAMALILGYISDWLEQPGFTMVIALLAGLALTEAAGPHRGDPSPGASLRELGPG